MQFQGPLSFGSSTESIIVYNNIWMMEKQVNTAEFDLPEVLAE